MEIDEGVEEIVHRFNVEMSDKDRDVLIRHAKQNMPQEEYEDMLIQWSFVDIIKLAINDAEKKNSEAE